MIMKKIGRQQRHRRIAKKIRGSDSQPRLVIFRSKKHIYAQLVNDSIQKVLAGCSTLSKEFKTKNEKTTGKDAAREIGKTIAQKALSLGIKSIRYDRGGYKYHGRVKSLAEGAKKGGLNF